MTKRSAICSTGSAASRGRFAGFAAWLKRTLIVPIFSKVLLASHIKTCVTQDIRAGKDETIDELLTTLQKLMR